MGKHKYKLLALYDNDITAFPCVGAGKGVGDRRGVMSQPQKTSCPRTGGAAHRVE